MVWSSRDWVTEVTDPVRHRNYKDYRGGELMKHSPIWCAAAIAGIAATVESYAIRELVAALLIFSVIFIGVSAGLLILGLTEEMAVKGIAILECRLAAVQAGHANAAHKAELFGINTRK